MTKKVLTLLLAATLCLCLVACNQSTTTVDYSVDNAYEVVVTDDDYALAFSPKGATPSEGLLFYVGTAIAPEHYTYLGNALAKQGYLVVIPKYDLNMTYLSYVDDEAAFTKYNNVKFFVGGHSQGGGTAVRRAQDMLDEVICQGLVLYSPLCYTHDIDNSDGTYTAVTDSVATAELPVLFIEASEDHVLRPAMKADSKTRVPADSTFYMIEGGCHMSFCTSDSDETLSIFGDGPLKGITRDEQRAQAVEQTLAFMKKVVTKA